MKKITIITTAAITVFVLAIGCRGKQDTGSAYMPDMAYSRAYETYAMRDTSKFTSNPAELGKKELIFYNNLPVKGTIKRGEMFPYTIPNDSAGVKMADAIKANPVAALSAAEMKETGRLYNINCGVCHGAKGEGNGPLATSGKVGGIKSVTTEAAKAYSDGRLFHIITYGQNLMGSYSSQLNRTQRWQMVHYVRSLQGVGVAKATTGADANAVKPAAADTAKTTTGK